MKVLVTRARASGEAIAARLRERGHEPVLLPLLEYSDCDAPLPQTRFDALAFTSAAAISILAARQPDEWSRLLALPAFCVGEATARAARQAGFRETVAGPGTAAALAELIAAELIPDEARANTGTRATPRLLYLAPKERAFDLAAALAAHGIEVDETVLYRARLGDPGKAALESALDACAGGAALLYSPRSAENLIGLASKYAIADRLAGLTLMAISENVARAIAGRGFPDILVSEKPHEDGLLELLDRLGRNGRASSGE